MSSFPGGPTLQIDGRVYTDLTNLLEFNAHIDTGNNNCSARASNASAGYAVTALKSLTVTSIRLNWLVAFANAGLDTVTIGYSDNDVGYGTNTAPTNPVYIFGKNNQTGGLTTTGLLSLASPPDLKREISFKFVIPAGKYILIQASSGVATVNMQLFGYEA